MDLNDPRLTAYALGEMNPSEAESFKKEIQNDLQAQRFIREIQEISEASQAWLKKEPLPELSPTERKTILKVTEAQNQYQNQKKKYFNFKWYFSVPAALAMATFAAVMISHQGILDQFHPFGMKPIERVAKYPITPPPLADLAIPKAVDRDDANRADVKSEVAAEAKSEAKLEGQLQAQQDPRSPAPLDADSERRLKNTSEQGYLAKEEMKAEAPGAPNEGNANAVAANDLNGAGAVGGAAGGQVGGSAGGAVGDSAGGVANEPAATASAAKTAELNQALNKDKAGAVAGLRNQEGLGSLQKDSRGGFGYQAQKTQDPRPGALGIGTKGVSGGKGYAGADSALVKSRAVRQEISKAKAPAPMLAPAPAASVATASPPSASQAPSKVLAKPDSQAALSNMTARPKREGYGAGYGETYGKGYGAVEKQAEKTEKLAANKSAGRGANLPDSIPADKPIAPKKEAPKADGLDRSEFSRTGPEAEIAKKQSVAATESLADEKVLAGPNGSIRKAPSTPESKKVSKPAAASTISWDLFFLGEEQGLSEEDVRKVLTLNEKTLSSCWAKLRGKVDSGKKISLAYGISINPKGGLSQVQSLKKSGAKEPAVSAVDSCLLAKIKQMRFSKSEHQMGTRFQIKFQKLNTQQ